MASVFRARLARVLLSFLAITFCFTEHSIACGVHRLMRSQMELDCITKHTSTAVINANDRIRGLVDPSQWTKWNAHTAEIEKVATQKQAAERAAIAEEMGRRAERAAERARLEALNSALPPRQRGGIFTERPGTFSESRGTFSEQRGAFREKRGTFGERRDTFRDKRGTFGEERKTFSEERHTFSDARGSFSEPRGTFKEKVGTFTEKPCTFSDNCWRRKRRPSSPEVGSGNPASTIFNETTGEALVPAGPNHVGTRDGRLYVPAGPNNIIDTRTGQSISVH